MNYSRGTLSGSLFSDGATLRGLGDWWDWDGEDNAAAPVDQNATDGGPIYKGTTPTSYKGAQSKDYVPASGAATPVEYATPDRDRNEGATSTDDYSFWDSGPSASSSFAPDAGTVATPAPAAIKAAPAGTRPPATKATTSTRLAVPRTPTSTVTPAPAGLSTRAKVGIGVGLGVVVVGLLMVFSRKDTLRTCATTLAEASTAASSPAAPPSLASATGGTT